MERFEQTVNTGRKGIAYDWQSLYAEAMAARLDAELPSLSLQYAE